jgi:RNA methyltransferase, TrmH family
MEMITSTSNPVVKQARTLHQRKGRAESGLFLVEGIHHVGEAIEAGWTIHSIFYAPDLLTSEFANDLLERAQLSGRKSQPVSVKVMESLAEKDNPQGIVAVVHQKQTPRDKLGRFQRGVALVSPQDPGNVGTILRSMDAVGADVLFLLDGGVELFHPTVVRASMGALFWMPIVEMGFQDFRFLMESWPHQIIGASAHADMDHRTLTPDAMWILLLGSEQKGLTADQTSACDAIISLPMRGRTSSLNLAVAAGVLLYQLTDKHP